MPRGGGSGWGLCCPSAIAAAPWEHGAAEPAPADLEGPLAGRKHENWANGLAGVSASGVHSR